MDVIDPFSEVCGGRGGAIADDGIARDGRPEPMSAGQVLATVKFLAPELAGRAGSRTKAWRDGPSASWTLAYVCFRATGDADLTGWLRAADSPFWAECGFAKPPANAEAERFLADVHQRLTGAPVTIACLAQVIADLAACGVAPVARIDSATLTTVRAPSSKP
ncbi:MAG: hypothetical protein ABSG43_18500 [Solirubrobacteraceae bacterium]|jgi:hypothetical protein